MKDRVIATIYESFIWANFEAEPELLTPELLADIENRIQDNLYWFLEEQIDKALRNAEALKD